MVKRRRRERELTPEEAIETLKKDLTPFWHGYKPLFAGVKTEKGTAVYPLEPGFAEKNWFMYFIEATDPALDRLMIFLREMYRRYSEHSISWLVVLSTNSSLFKNRKFAENWIKSSQIPVPVVFDLGGALSEGFSKGTVPKILFFEKGKLLHEYVGDSFVHVELPIQEFLRRGDPGLPLAMPFKPEAFQEFKFIDFGKLTTRSPAGYSIKANGKWTQEDERMVTDEVGASIQITGDVGDFYFIVQSLSEHGATATVVIDLDGISVKQASLGKDLGLDEEGRSRAIIGPVRLYHAINNLSPTRRQVTLRFAGPKGSPLAVYGVRFL